MRKLEQIKDEVAVDYGYSDYEDMESNILFEGHDTEDMPAFDAIAELYATEAIKANTEMYKECLETFLPEDKWDEATAFLSSYGSGLAKDLQQREK